jgi:hypothetical protein
VEPPPNGDIGEKSEKKCLKRKKMSEPLIKLINMIELIQAKPEKKRSGQTSA